MSATDIDIEEVQAEIAERSERDERQRARDPGLSARDLEDKVRETLAREAWRLNRLTAD